MTYVIWNLRLKFVIIHVIFTIKVIQSSYDV